MLVSLHVRDLAHPKPVYQYLQFHLPSLLLLVLLPLNFNSPIFQWK